jgi:serine protease Do
MNKLISFILRRKNQILSKIFSFPLVLIFFILSCSEYKQVQKEIVAPVDWPKIKKSEAEFRKYFEENAGKLEILEGIWLVTTGGTWRNVLSGITGSISPETPYRLAIIKDTTNSGYDFIAVVLESEYPHWTSGNVKAYFRKTAFEKVFEALWFASDFSRRREIYTMDKLGIIKNTHITYDEDNPYIEYNLETILLKIYPSVTDESHIKPPYKNLKTSASGFLVTANGLVVTNYHVVENAEKIEVIFAQKNITKSASLKIRDIKNDIAILELKDFSFEEISSEPIPFTFADVSTVKVGQEVYTLGYPLGDIMGTKPRVSLGRINSLFGIQDDPRLYQISNPLQPGNSGGPLFNTKGELVGIVVSSLNAKYLYESAGIIPQNINFAIKSNYLQNLLFLIPEGKEAINRKNLFKSDLIEDQIEKITPFIVQIRVY